MKCLSVEQIEKLNILMCEQTGGSAGIREMGLLESALMSAFSTFGGNDLYPSVLEKIAKICYSLISNHAFVDGNKRIGILVMLVLAKINDINLKLTNSDIIDLGLGVASSKYDYNNILAWLQQHKK